jgi:hypothetical protein
MPLQAHGPWTLPIEGFEVYAITFGGLIDVLSAGAEGARAKIRFESAFRFGEPGESPLELNPATDSWQDLAVIMTLRHDRIVAAVATEADACLRVEFESGRLLTAEPDPRYENWAVTAPDFQLISRPGGGVAHFGA